MSFQKWRKQQSSHNRSPLFYFASTMYIEKVAPARHRGKLEILNILVIFIGQSSAFFSNFFLWDYGGVDNWRWIMVIPFAVLLLLLFFIPEGPRW